jgi:DNA-binding transcriptional LysR family regulator
MNQMNFRTLDLNLLRIFDVVMAERSLTRAAHKLALTQPAVSNAMRRLRDSLGEDLMRRDGQGLSPTPRALALWPQVRTALSQLELGLNPGEFVPAQADATFVLAMADATAAELMPGLVDILEREAPGVSMRILPLSTRNPSAMLEQELIDVAVGYFPALLAELSAPTPVEGGHALAHQRLFDGQYVCVMRHDHPLAAQDLDLDTFCQARHLLVSFSGRPFGFVDEALASLGRERHVVLTVNQFFTAGQALAVSSAHRACGHGVAQALAPAQRPPVVAPSRGARQPSDAGQNQSLTGPARPRSTWKRACTVRSARVPAGKGVVRNSHVAACGWMSIKAYPRSSARA